MFKRNCCVLQAEASKKADQQMRADTQTRRHTTQRHIFGYDFAKCKVTNFLKSQKIVINNKKINK